jgi:trimethylamine:corrinoid methyltransferase-like protein
MKLGLNFLSEDEKQRIHRDSIKILSRVGVKYLSNKALKILEKNGAGVDYDTRIAKIPQEMVNEALKRAPKSFVLGARNPEFDFAMPSSFTTYTLDGAATFALDFKTGKRRNAITQDLIDSLRIFEEMCEAYLELAKYHVPILPFPMPAAGSTGPASLYSDTAVANAESLSALYG